MLQPELNHFQHPGAAGNLPVQQLLWHVCVSFQLPGQREEGGQQEQQVPGRDVCRYIQVKNTIQPDQLIYVPTKQIHRSCLPFLFISCTL